MRRRLRPVGVVGGCSTTTHKRQHHWRRLNCRPTAYSPAHAANTPPGIPAGGFALLATRAQLAPSIKVTVEKDGFPFGRRGERRKVPQLRNVLGNESAIE